MKKFSLILFSVLLASVSCENLDDAEYLEDIKLGAVLKELQCAADHGNCSFDVVSNRAFRAHIIEGGEWLRFPDESLAEKLPRNASVALSFTSNNGYRRSARLVLSAGVRHDTLTVKQEGLYHESISVETAAFAVPGAGGVYSTRVNTNLLPADLHFEADKAGVSDYVYADNVLTFRVAESRSRDVVKITVSVFAVDGWGERVAAKVVLTQQPGK